MLNMVSRNRSVAGLSFVESIEKSLLLLSVPPVILISLLQCGADDVGIVVGVCLQLLVVRGHRGQLKLLHRVQ